MKHKYCPKVGQQVFVEYLDTYLVPNYFAGWCIDCHYGDSPVFTLADAFSARQFILFSPLVLSVVCSIPDYSDNEKRENDQNLDKNWEDDYDYDVENEDDLDAAFEEQNNEDDDY